MYENTPEIYREEYRKARKIHKCCECKKDINPGQEYKYAVGKWEGEFNYYRWCLECDEIKIYIMNRFSESIIFGELLETQKELRNY